MDGIDLVSMLRIFEIGWEVKRFTGLEVFGFRFLVFSFIIKPRRGARVVEWGTLLMC